MLVELFGAKKRRVPRDVMKSVAFAVSIMLGTINFCLIIDYKQNSQAFVRGVLVFSRLSFYRKPFCRRQVIGSQFDRGPVTE